MKKRSFSLPYLFIFPYQFIMLMLITTFIWKKLFFISVEINEKGHNFLGKWNISESWWYIPIWKNIDLNIIKFSDFLNDFIPMWKINNFLYEFVYIAPILFYGFVIFYWWKENKKNNNKKFLNLKEYEKNHFLILQHRFFYATCFAIFSTWITFFLIPIQYPIDCKGCRQMQSFPSFHAVTPFMGFLFVKELNKYKKAFWVSSTKWLLLIFSLLIFWNIIAFKKHYVIDGLGSILYGFLAWNLTKKLRIEFFPKKAEIIKVSVGVFLFPILLTLIIVVMGGRGFDYF